MAAFSLCRRKPQEGPLLGVRRFSLRLGTTGEPPQGKASLSIPHTSLLRGSGSLRPETLLLLLALRGNEVAGIGCDGAAEPILGTYTAICGVVIGSHAQKQTGL